MWLEHIHSGNPIRNYPRYKQMAVHPRYRGHLCFQFRGQLYYYKVCPFGAVVSAHFWSRLGGAFQRLFHRMCVFAPRFVLVG